ncbi:hypothetical protein ACFLT9_02610 [Acidobacteriota bacterium]
MNQYKVAKEAIMNTPHPPRLHIPVIPATVSGVVRPPNKTTDFD